MLPGVSKGLKAETVVAFLMGVRGRHDCVVTIELGREEPDDGREIWTSFGLPGPTRTVASIC